MILFHIRAPISRRYGCTLLSWRSGLRAWRRGGGARAGGRRGEREGAWAGDAGLEYLIII
ncbi:MAG: hypothetical protein OIN66_14740 [Candidatus Methanoperedens sp.]|nr:hypothetical protein [Candidatus Methanoperedens sp.]